MNPVPGAGLGDGNALVVDCRPVERIKPRDAAAFDATRDAVEQLGWRYRVVGATDTIVTRNVRWLGGYRHPRHDLPVVAAALREAFAEPDGLMAGAEAVGDPIAVLPVLYHLLWRHDLMADLSVALHPDTVVTVASPAVEPFRLLDALPADVLAEARRWQRHVVEVETGLAPDAAKGRAPRPSMTRRGPRSPSGTRRKPQGQFATAGFADDDDPTPLRDLLPGEHTAWLDGDIAGLHLDTVRDTGRRNPVRLLVSREPHLTDRSPHPLPP
jgi:hypothetical protein